MPDTSIHQISRLSRLITPTLGEWLRSSYDDRAKIGLRWGQEVAAYCSEVGQIYLEYCRQHSTEPGQRVQIGTASVQLFQTGRFHQGSFLKVRWSGEEVSAIGSLHRFDLDPQVYSVELKLKGMTCSIELDAWQRVTACIYQRSGEGQTASGSDSHNDTLRYRDEPNRQKR